MTEPNSPPQELSRWSLDPRVKEGLPYAIFVLLPTILVGKAVAGASMLAGGDVRSVFYFSRGFVGQELRSGRLPTWDPHTMCGFPLLAGMQSAVFYPLTWPVLVLSPGAFWTFTVWIHMILSGIFTFLWVHRGLRVGRWAAVVSGLVVVLSGYLATHVYAGHVSYVASYPWLPAILWRLDRFLAKPTLRRGVLLALPMSLLALAGFPHFLLFAWIALLARVTLAMLQSKGPLRKGLRLAGSSIAAAGLGMMVAAPQLLPTMELISNIQRVGSESYAFSTQFSFPPENLLTLLAPTLWGDSREVTYWGRWLPWEVCGYVGVASLSLAGLAVGCRHPQRRLWMAVAVAGLLVALGRYTPLYRILYSVVPGISLFRAPGRYLYFFTMAAAALAGIGFDRLWTADPSVRRATFRAGCVAGMLALLLGGGAALAAARPPVWEFATRALDLRRSWEISERVERTPEFEQARRRMGLAAASWACLAMGAAGTCLILVGRGRMAPRIASWAVGVILAAELLGFGWRYFVGEDDRDLAWPPGFAQDLKRRAPGPYRMASPGTSRIADVGRAQLAGLDHIGGYEPMMLSRYAQLLNVADGAPAERAAVLLSPAKPHRILRMLGVRFWLLTPGIVPPEGWVHVGMLGGGDPANIFEDRTALPRAFLVGTAAGIPEAKERLAFLARGEYDPTETVVLEEPTPPRTLQGPWRRGTVRLGAPFAGRYVLQVDSPDGGWLVLNETFYPGWNAEVDGKPVKIFQANHLVQTVALAPGHHEVRFEYRSRLLGWGFVLSFAAVATFIGIWIRGRFREKTVAATAS